MRIRNFTMEDYKKLYEEVKKDLISYGFPQIEEIQHTLSLDLKGYRIYGRCRKTRLNSSSATIYLNKSYADSTTIDRIKNTIMHELIHSIKGCSGHTGKWKDIAQMVTYKSQGTYEIKRLGTSCAEFKDTVTKERKPTQKTQNKFLITCNNCKKQFKYKTRCKAVRAIEKSPDGCRCPYCQGKNFSIKYL